MNSITLGGWSWIITEGGEVAFFGMSRMEIEWGIVGFFGGLI